MSILRPKAGCGIDAAQTEAIHAQGTQLTFIHPPQPLAMGGKGFSPESAAFISEKLP